MQVTKLPNGKYRASEKNHLDVIRDTRNEAIAGMIKLISYWKAVDKINHANKKNGGTIYKIKL